MPSSAPILNVIMFADDTNLFLSAKNLKNLFMKMNDEIDKINEWLAANKLSLNITKTNYVFFCSTSMEDDLPLKLPVIRIDGKEIKRVRFTKFLGVLLDENLTWKTQVSALETKISKQIGIIGHARKYLDDTPMKMLYYSFVQPYLIYGNIVWCSNAKWKVSKLHRLQKRAIRIINYAPRQAHSRPLMLSNKVLDIYEINLYQIMLFMLKAYKNQLPACLSNLFHRTKHKYPTISIKYLFYLKDDSNRINKFNISHRGPHIWNSFKSIIPCLLNAHCAKKFLKNTFLTPIRTNIW